ncbi:MAG: alpha/beta fold hydrolase [Chromatiales bacterium]|jgi:magnesium chelatase accessory protein
MSREADREPDEPDREAGRFVCVGDQRWHVLDRGQGPILLLLHGTGASAHSWDDLATLLARDFRVVAPDLPGHGSTALVSAAQASLPGMAQATAALMRHLRVSPALVIGHSAGAAILARMCLDGAIEPRGLVSLNGALLPLRGIPGHLFAPAARLLAGIPVVPGLFARRARDRRLVDRMVRQTGSRLSPAAVDRYWRLLRSPSHVRAALQMMAHWDLEPLARELRRLPCPLYLVTCENDHAVPPSEARRVRAMVPEARLMPISGLGHLGHEEDPELFASMVRSIVGEREAAEKAQGRVDREGM